MNTGLSIDRIVIAASNLEQGARYICAQLGVDIPFGGVHETMGTHNLLMRLGDSVFLEVIAINPDGAVPAQPRWYGLDDPYVRAAIAEEPSLVGWVVNTSAIDAVLAAATKGGMDFGKSVPVTRGGLTWKFGLPHDGRLLGAGMLPYIIEWETDSHPAALMADTGCTLVDITVAHPQADWVAGSLECIGARGQVNIVSADTPCLSVDINSPRGVVTLQSTRPELIGADSLV